VLLTIDLHEDLINEEGVAITSVSALQSLRVLGTEFDLPQTNGLIADGYAALRKQILYISMTEIESEVNPNGVLDDLRRESMAFVQRGGSSHPAIVDRPPLTCQYHALN
jgi:hypothetical protein